MELEDIIWKYAVKNAFDYGKANTKAVVGKVLAEHPELKSKVREVVELTNKLVERVNALSRKEIEEEVKKFEYVRVEKERKLLHDVQGPVVTRFPPEPSGYLHIGHAKAIFLNYEAAIENGGKMLLRFDDTNPKKESWEYVEAIREDLQWLSVSWAQETFTSDYIGKLYDVAKELIKKGYLYVSTAKGEEIKRARSEGIPIPGRDNSVEENLELFERMLSNEFSEGEAVVLFKGNPNDRNTVMRDPTMLRIVETPHYRVGDKFIVWPTYDFAVPFVDSWEGVTHAMRSKEYELRERLYYALLEAMGMRKPILIHFSRLSIRNVPVSKRFLRRFVEEGLVMGWDDPRMPTLRGLRRRGIHPEAIKRFALRFGIGKQEKVVSWDFLEVENRKVLDAIAKRAFFVWNPVELKIDAPEKEVSIPFHPNKEMGFRRLKFKGRVYITEEDWKRLKRGEVLRLKHLFTIVYRNGKVELTDEENFSVVQWLPVEEVREAKVWAVGPLLKDDGSFNNDSLLTYQGFVENIPFKTGEIWQFERFGFVRVDETGVFVKGS